MAKLIRAAQSYIPAEAVAETTAPVDRETGANTWPQKRIHFIPFTSEGKIRLATDVTIRSEKGQDTLKKDSWVSLERAGSPEIPALIRVE